MCPVSGRPHVVAHGRPTYRGVLFAGAGIHPLAYAVGRVRHTTVPVRTARIGILRHHRLAFGSTMPGPLPLVDANQGLDQQPHICCDMLGRLRRDLVLGGDGLQNGRHRLDPYEEPNRFHLPLGRRWPRLPRSTRDPLPAQLERVTRRHTWNREHGRTLATP